MYYSKACTSIVAEDSKGTIWHARNLDYGAIDENLSEVLKNITMEVDFMRNGEVGITIYACCLGSAYICKLMGGL